MLLFGILVGFVGRNPYWVYVFLKKGYTLKRSYSMQKTEGTIFTVLQLVILALLVAAPAFIHFTETDGGPGQSTLQSGSLLWPDWW